MVFYKGVLQKDLSQQYIPGTVTTVFNEALMWKERIESSKKKGAAKHIRHGQAVVIEIEFNGELISHDEFQRNGVHEHHRNNCWTSQAKDKAQINEVVKYRILTDIDINRLYKP